MDSARFGRKAGRTAQLWSRNQKNFARRFLGVVKSLAQLPNDSVIDGEVVVLDERRSGHSICYRTSTAEFLPSCYMPSICSCYATATPNFGRLRKRRDELRQAIKHPTR